MSESRRGHKGTKHKEERRMRRGLEAGVSLRGQHTRDLLVMFTFWGFFLEGSSIIVWLSGIPKTQLAASVDLNERSN